MFMKKRPDTGLTTESDFEKYYKILEASNAHRKKHDKNEDLRKHTSLKFMKIIAPMFEDENKRGGSLLPQYKVSKTNMHVNYVHWDDPNELVDRLRLLVAERSAGNSSHDNEIISIIEELREGGYIY